MELTFMFGVDNIKTRQGHHHVMNGVIINIIFFNIGGCGCKSTSIAV